MPELIDPNDLPTKKTPTKPSQVIAWLLYPVIFVVGLSAGIVIGLQQATTNTNTTTENTNTQQFTNSSIVSGNANTSANTNISANTNTTTNASILPAGDYLKIDPATETQLDQQKQQKLDQLVDKTLSFVDILRQQDLIELQYNLNIFHAVRGTYPTTDGKQVRLDKQEQDVFYAAMKEFFGGTFYQKIDPESPTYYYGYTSDGTTYTLTALLKTKNQPFILASE